MSNRISSLEANGVKVETIIENIDLVEGNTLSGTVYITTLEEEERIDYISLRVLCEDAAGELQMIAKHSFELVGSIHSKDAEIVPFEIIPDDRWKCGEDDYLVFQTTVVFLDGTEIYENGKITYTVE